MATRPNVKAEARLESQLRAKSNALKSTDKKYKTLLEQVARKLFELGLYDEAITVIKSAYKK